MKILLFNHSIMLSSYDRYMPVFLIKVMEIYMFEEFSETEIIVCLERAIFIKL